MRCLCKLLDRPGDGGTSEALGLASDPLTAEVQACVGGERGSEAARHSIDRRPPSLSVSLGPPYFLGLHHLMLSIALTYGSSTRALQYVDMQDMQNMRTRTALDRCDQ